MQVRGAEVALRCGGFGGLRLCGSGRGLRGVGFEAGGVRGGGLGELLPAQGVRCGALLPGGGGA